MVQMHANRWIAGALALAPALVAAQGQGRPQLAGTWKAETPDGPRQVVIRADSSASYGDETVRWRVAGDSIHLAFGDEWMVNGYHVKDKQLTLSGGDLEDPITLRRIGPATPRPDSITVPPAPAADRRASEFPAPKPSRVPGVPHRPGRAKSG